VFVYLTAFLTGTHAESLKGSEEWHGCLRGVVAICPLVATSNAGRATHIHTPILSLSSLSPSLSLSLSLSRTHTHTHTRVGMLINSEVAGVELDDDLAHDFAKMLTDVNPKGAPVSICLCSLCASCDCVRSCRVYAFAFRLHTTQHTIWICNGRHANTIFGVSIYNGSWQS
jgi:hypothetical protein